MTGRGWEMEDNKHAYGKHGKIGVEYPMEQEIRPPALRSIQSCSLELSGFDISEVRASEDTWSQRTHGMPRPCSRQDRRGGEVRHRPDADTEMFEQDEIHQMQDGDRVGDPDSYERLPSISECGGCCVVALQYVAPARILGVAAAHLLPANTQHADSSHRGTHVSLSAAEYREEGGVAGFSALGRMIQTLRPLILLVPDGLDAAISDELDHCRSIESGDAGMRGYWEDLIVKNVPKASFHPDRAMARIVQIRIEKRGGDWEGERGKGGRCVTGRPRGLDVSNKQMCRSIGALLYFLDGWSNRSMEPDISYEETAGYDMQNEGSTASLHQVRVADFSPLFLSGLLSVDSNTTSALAVFDAEQHPSKMGLGVAKEGYSLYGMFSSMCASSMGKQTLKAWLLRPLDDVHEIEERLDGVAYFFLQAPRALDVLSEIVGRTSDVFVILRRLGYVSFDSKTTTWIQLVASITSFIRAKEVLYELFQGNRNRRDGGEVAPGPMFEKIFQAIASSDLEALLSLITGVIDLSQSQNTHVGSEGRGCTVIAPGVLPELDQLKATYQRLPAILDESVQKLFHRMPRYLVSNDILASDWRIVYIPQMGYMLRTSGPLGDGAIEAIDDMSFAFSDKDANYYVTRETLALSNELGDVYAKILDAESSVLLQLKMKCLEARCVVESAARAISRLDCIMAFAKAARLFGYARPQFAAASDGDFLSFKAGRHVIAERLNMMRLDLKKDTRDVPSEFCPNDTRIGHKCAPTGPSGSDGDQCFDAGRIHVITGPNNSGKSVYTRQVALIVFLAQIGSFVPAERVELTLVDKLFAPRCSAPASEQIVVKIGRGSSCDHQEGISSFLSDISHVAGAIKHSTRRSLVIIDEFGRGTLPSNGVALLSSTLTYIAEMEKMRQGQLGHPFMGCPKTLAVTHFSEIVGNRVLLADSPLIRYFAMQGYLRDNVETGRGEYTFSTSADGQSASIPDSPLNPFNSELIFLYKLTEMDTRQQWTQAGNATAYGSYAFHAAMRAGCSHDVVKRAMQAVHAILSSRYPNGGADSREMDAEFAFRKRDDRVDKKIGLARKTCERLVSMYEGISKDGVDPHETLLRHHPSRMDIKNEGESNERNG